tara:strand:- start:198 stop:455 length:258 start_codon:yes stop_codon:yes gene_type:complete
MHKSGLLHSAKNSLQLQQGAPSIKSAPLFSARAGGPDRQENSIRQRWLFEGFVVSMARDQLRPTSCFDARNPIFIHFDVAIFFLV